MKTGLKNLVSKAGAVIAAVGMFTAVYFGVIQLIDSRIDNPEFLDKLASRVRPSVVFDANGSVLSDLGAMEFVDDILVEHNEKGRVSTITVRPNRHLPQAPMLSPADSNRFDYASKRGKKFDWLYEIYESTYLVTEDSRVLDAPQKFRLEVIR